ncbi:hypothetical protein M5E86_20960 [Blautia wexlerae]|nr:hypothetical protein M5E86_20960 [Blautia wexlerae]
MTDTIGGYWESAGRSDIGDTYDSVLSILQLGLLVTSLLLLFVSVLGQINIGLSSLEQRTHELLIRRAIGASRTNIVALVLGSQLILSIFVCLASYFDFADFGALYWSVAPCGFPGGNTELSNQRCCCCSCCVCAYSIIGRIITSIESGSKIRACIGS